MLSKFIGNQTPQKTVAEIEQILAELQANLATAEDNLKAAKEARAKIPFDGGDSAAASNKVRGLEADIESIGQSIKEGRERLRQQRKAEYSVEIADLWKRIQAHYLRCHDLAKQIEGVCSEIKTCEQRYIDVTSQMHELGLNSPRRIKNVAIKKRANSVDWGDIGAVERRLMNEEILRFLNGDNFPAGRDYSSTEVAAIMEGMSNLTIADAVSS